MKFTSLNKLICLVLGISVLLPQSVLASEEVDDCEERITGYILGTMDDVNVTGGMEEEISNFCLESNAVWSSDDEVYRGYVEVFLAYELNSKEILNTLFEDFNYSGATMEAAEDSVDYHYEYIYDLKVEYAEVLLDDYDDGYASAENARLYILDYYDDFLELYDQIQEGLESNYYCEDYLNGGDCYCFDGFESSDDGSVCVEESGEVTNEDSVAGENATEGTIFDDLDDTDDNYQAISYLYDEGVISGYPDNTFRADNPLNRAELLKILVEGKGITPDEGIYKNCFPDVGTEWFAKYVCYAKEQDWIEGYPDNTFKPASNVNKAEALKMLLEVFSVDTDVSISSEYSDVPSDQWFTKYILTAESLDLLEEINVYLPASDITRGGISENIYRLLIQL